MPESMALAPNNANPSPFGQATRTSIENLQKTNVRGCSICKSAGSIDWLYRNQWENRTLFIGFAVIYGKFWHIFIPNFLIYKWKRFRMLCCLLFFLIFVIYGRLFFVFRCLNSNDCFLSNFNHKLRYSKVATPHRR